MLTAKINVSVAAVALAKPMRVCSTHIPATVLKHQALATKLTQNALERTLRVYA